MKLRTLAALAVVLTAMSVLSLLSAFPASATDVVGAEATSEDTSAAVQSEHTESEASSPELIGEIPGEDENELPFLEEAPPEPEARQSAECRLYCDGLWTPTQLAGDCAGCHNLLCPDGSEPESVMCNSQRPTS